MPNINILLFTQMIKKIANSPGNLEKEDADILEKIMNQLGLLNNTGNTALLGFEQADTYAAISNNRNDIRLVSVITDETLGGSKGLYIFSGSNQLIQIVAG